jgi:hypothetical protein
LFSFDDVIILKVFKNVYYQDAQITGKFLFILANKFCLTKMPEVLYTEILAFLRAETPRAFLKTKRGRAISSSLEKGTTQATVK